MPLPYLPLLMKNYTPVLHPMPALTITEYDQCPAVCVRFSKELVPYLLGLLEIYRWEDKFSGTPEEVANSLGVIQDFVAALMEACVCCCDDNQPKTPTNQRFNPATNRLEVSYDNGATWETDPNDARFNTPLLPPAPGAPGDEKRCQAASNVTDALKKSVAFMIETVGTANNAFETVILVLGFVAALIGAIFSGGLAIPAALAAAAALIQSIYNNVTSYGIEAFTAAFTDDEWDIALCVIYCNTQPDGSYTQANWNAIMTKLKVELAYKSQVATSLANFINSYGPAGLNNIARSRSVTAGDCDSCADCGDSCAASEQETYFTFGTVISVTGAVVRVQAQLYTPPAGDPFYLIQWGTYGTIGTKCCQWQAVDVVSGGTWDNTQTEFTDCGGTVHMNLDPTHTDVTHVSLYPTGAAILDITFPE